MSYEAWGDGPDEDTWTERVAEAGWLDSGVVERLRELLRHVEYPEDFPRPGNKSDAAC